MKIVIHQIALFNGIKTQEETEEIILSLTRGYERETSSDKKSVCDYF